MEVLKYTGTHPTFGIASGITDEAWVVTLRASLARALERMVRG
jgi:hypothetical protein